MGRTKGDAGLGELFVRKMSCLTKRDMRPNLSYKLLAVAALLSASLASAQLRLEQRISGFPEVEKLGEFMVTEGDWAALGSRSNPTTHRGRVQICRRQAGVWAAVQSLEAPANNTYEDLALSGDWLAVQEHGDVTFLNGGQMPTQGVVRMLHRQGDNWVHVQSLKPDLASLEAGGGTNFSSKIVLHGDQLVVLAHRYSWADAPGSYEDHVYLPLHFYRLRGGSWQLEQILPDPVGRPGGYGSPDVSLHEDWLAVGHQSSPSIDWLPAGAVQLYRRETGKWKAAQTLTASPDLPHLLFGTHVAFAGGGHLLVSAQSSVLASRWNGSQWTAPEPVDAGPVDARASFTGYLPVVKAAGNVAVAYSNKVISLMHRSENGWRFTRTLPVESPIPSLGFSEETVLFLSDFIPSFLRWRAVSFLPVADLEVRLGRPEVESQHPAMTVESSPVSAGTEVAWQSLLDGDEMPLVVTNTTPNLLPRPLITLSGDMAASFETTPQVQTAALMVPGETMTYGIRPRSGVQVNEALVTVTFTTGGALPDFTFTVRWRRSAPVQGPPQVRLLRGSFWELGQPAHLIPVITGVLASGPVIYRWLRDEVEVAGQNHATLVIPEAKPEHAGTYELEVTHSGGTTRSEPSQVAIFAPVEKSTRLRDGETGQLETRFWGAVEVVWQNPENYLEDLTTPYLAGITLPTLTVIDGRWIDPGGRSELEATGILLDPVSQGQVSFAILARHQLVSVGRKPNVLPVHNRVFAVGDSIGESAAILEHARDWYGGRNGWPGSVLTASGLPPEVTLHTDGTLAGTFEKAGIYKVTWRVKDASGMVSDPAYSEFIIGQTGPATDAGLHVGWVAGPAEIPGMDFGGCLELKVEVTGAFSGVLKVPGALRRFAGKLRDRPEDPGVYEAEVAMAALPGTTSTKVKVRSVPGMEWLTVVMPCILKEDGREEELTSTLRHRIRLPLPLAAGKVGSYNSLLDLSEVYDERPVPAGTGLMRVTATKTLSGQVVGTLADGTGITCAGHLMPDDYGTSLLLFVEGSPVRFLLGGELRAGSPERPLFLEGSLRWKKPQVTTAKLDPEGFDLNLRTEGWRYILPPSGVLLLSECPNNPANAFCQTELMEDGVLRLTSNHRAIPHTTRSANRLKRLDVYAPTGFFTGQITTGGQTLPSGVKVPAKTVPFRGIILPPFSLGGGFYHFAQPGSRPESRPLRVRSF